MKRMTFILLAILLLTMPQWATTAPATAAATGEGLTELREEEANCLFFTETVEGEGAFSVCDDQEANFRTAFEDWGLQKIGYPISQRYDHDGFVTQAFQKAIMQWQAESSTVALVNIFDDLHNAGFDDTLLSVRQTPDQLPAGWDGDIPFDEVVQKRQALLEKRPALQETYFASSDPLTFYGLPTSEVEDMDNHYAIRLQRAVLQEWKQEVPWAKEGEVTIANGGDIAKELDALPAEALMPIPPESGPGMGPGMGPGSEGGPPSSATTSFQLSSIESMKWANNRTLVVAEADAIWVYDTNALDSEPRQLPGEIGKVTSLAVSQDNLWLAAGLESGQILLWSLTSDDQPNVLADHTTPVWDLVFTPNGNLLLSGGGINHPAITGTPDSYEDTHLRLWNVKSGSKMAQLTNARGQVTALAISADGTTVMAGTYDALAGRDLPCNGSIQYWDIESGEQIGADRVGHPLWFSPEGAMGVTRKCYDSTIQLWETSSRSVLKEFEPSTENKFPYSLRLSQNGAILAAAVGEYGLPAENIVVWDVGTGAELAILPSHTPIALSPNGDLVASGNGTNDHNLRLWEIGANENEPLAIVGGHDQPVSHIAFSPDGNWLASTSEEGRLQLANLQSLLPEPEVTMGEAYIDDVEILVMESSPVQISVVLRGHLADGCTTLHEITQINGEDNTIMLNVTTIRPFREACTLALVPFEETFSLDLTELTPGSYTINANGTTATLELTADMLGSRQ
ncbi:MAG: WD40 repeat domain-containing protein [Ardenticatenaceae bacterium]